MSGKTWSDSEKEFLRQNYSILSMDALILELKRSKASIHLMASRLKVDLRRPKWTLEEIDEVKFGKTPIEAISGRSVKAVRSLAFRQGIRANSRKEYTAEEQSCLLAMWPTANRGQREGLAKKFNSTYRALKAKYERLKLRTER